MTLGEKYFNFITK